MTQFQQLIELYQSHDFKALQEQLNQIHPADLAEHFDQLEEGKQVIVFFRLLDKDLAAEVFAHLESDVAEDIITSMTDTEVQEIIENLYTDDAVDLVQELPSNLVSRILRLTKANTRNLINRYLNYKEGSAGSVMTSEIMNLRKDMTVAEAINKIRKTKGRFETIYTCYITDHHRHLEGVVSLKQLLSARDDQYIYEIMETNVISTTTNAMDEDIINLFDIYDFLALPVVDNEQRLVGIITYDDLLDLVNELHTENLQIMAAITPDSRPYLSTSAWGHAKNRIVWLMVLMISGMINGMILGRFEHAFVILPILVTFIPMLTGSGGNAGAQSSTLIIRGMTLKEIAFSDIWHIIVKELQIGAITGLVMGTINFLRIYFFIEANVLLALTVSIALMVIIMMAKMFGVILPLGAKFFKLDPAIMAAPLITTLVDAFGLIIYFLVAERLLGLVI